MKQISDEEIELIKHHINERKIRDAYKILNNLTEIIEPKPEVQEVKETKEVTDGRNV